MRCMRFYELDCLRGTETATTYRFETWAMGVMDAFEKARIAGYWPLSVVRSGWTQTDAR